MQDKKNLLSFLNSFFRLDERQTTVKTEFIAALTTFMTVSYIILVNPIILSEAGMPKEAALAGTILAIVITTLLMGLWANLPIVIGPGMGLNAFFTYTVVLGQGLSWETALGAVFISGFVFFLLSVTGVSSKVVAAIPKTLKASITAGIGLFVAFIGLKNGGIIVPDDATYVALGNIADQGTWLALLGLILASVLVSRNIRGGLILSIFVISALSMLIGHSPVPNSPDDIISFDWPSVELTFMKLDIMAAIGYGIFSVIFSFTIVELFDTLATLIGLTKKANLNDENDETPNMKRALTTGALGTMISAVFGSTAMNTYIENATGIAEGGRTGLKAVFAALLFLLTLLFTPLIQYIPNAATAPVLIIIGAFMMTELKEIHFDDLTELIPAFLTFIMMPLTFSIAEGVAFGFISYTLLKVFTGRTKELHWMMYIITAAFLINFYTMI
ncbi:NCS2 family permease [Bacillus sp. CMF21]|uniref:NCS2 family permease n=1 Tax=Metabacillus dongyingensis TaxID=2874282 RepID=UPI001CBD2867|nr:NCS2 family permease [Metabacillus dongyingensis]UAL50381.1 NCS2 family permease [Metabacillus dongyingensis]USK26635.1 NCS2 family permease [Bacillus sp. CMF21]